MNIGWVRPRWQAQIAVSTKARAETPSALAKDFDAKHRVLPLRRSYEDLEEERRSTDRLGA